MPQNSNIKIFAWRKFLQDENFLQNLKEGQCQTEKEFFLQKCMSEISNTNKQQFCQVRKRLTPSCEAPWVGPRSQQEALRTSLQSLFCTGWERGLWAWRFGLRVCFGKAELPWVLSFWDTCSCQSGLSLGISLWGQQIAWDWWYQHGLVTSKWEREIMSLSLGVCYHTSSEKTSGLLSPCIPGWPTAKPHDPEVTSPHFFIYCWPHMLSLLGPISEPWS